MAPSEDSSDDRPQSRWGADFWSKYRKLSSLIASRPDGYPPRQLIPKPQATRQIRNTEKLLTHVTGLVDAKRDAAGDMWTENVAELQLNREGENRVVHVSLSDVSSWTPQQTTITRQQKGRAAGTETITVRGYLPPTVATELFRQFQRVLDHLGWAENIVTRDYRAGEDEVATHQ